MGDYMEALHQRFNTAPSSLRDLEQTADQAHRELSHQLEPTERKLLLRLVDLQESLLYETSVNSFTAGFRLACGIVHELNMTEPYSFLKEEEQRILAKPEREEM
jgi:hypothetical protein